MDRPSRLAFAIALLLLPVSLAGCGGSSKGPKETVFRGIYTTSVDCGESGKISIEDCSTAINSAMQKHEATAPTYTELRFCENKEGVGKCEAAGAGKYRPKLLAFLIADKKPPEGTPLYAHAKGEAGFRDQAGTLYLHKDETLVFSEHAVTTFEGMTKKRR